MRPDACMKAWQIVGPTNLKPHFFKFLLILSDSGELDRSWELFFHLFTIGLPLTKFQIYLSKDLNSICVFRNARALLIVARIFCLLRIMSVSFISLPTSREVNLAMRLGLKLAKAFLNPARLCKIIRQDKPA